MSWGRKEVDRRSKTIMPEIHDKCASDEDVDGYTCYVRGANLAGFQKVTDATLAYGLV
ncbi:NAD(P)-specific glutamate dehydrogenase [Stieleria neptunia]|uniref:NAD(P)-specific glutamate dehydrogenase n=1 Tax=Stieleria neptunia TaxID=2527979 RepID=A0A518HNI9_9BACT|nr:NAD(P)-specific glutamate dehydrogenase [Stieleria neptunia]